MLTIPEIKTISNLKTQEIFYSWTTFILYKNTIKFIRPNKSL